MDPEEKAKILNGVKSMLRAVLQSSKEGVVAARLPGEYRGITGDPLPFKKLGYCTAEEFLRTLPDVVSARHNRDGELTYFAVADDSTAHIQRMVSAQRSNKSKKKGKGYRGKHLKVNVQSRRPVPSPYRKTGGGRFGPKIQRYSPPKMTLSRTSMIPHHTKQMAPARNSSSFEVPPRFQKTSSNMASSVPAAKSASSSSLKVTVPNTKNDKVFVNYKSALYEYAAKTKKSVYYNKTDSTKVGFVSSLCLEGVVYGSEDGYKSMKEAEQAAAMNACHALGIKVAGSPSPPRVVSVRGTEGKSAVSEEILKSRVRQIMEGRKNGLWNTRLPIEYKQQFNEAPPPDLMDRVQSWTDCVKVESVVGTDRKILYPEMRRLYAVSPTPESSAKDSEKKEKLRILPPVLPALGTDICVCVTHVKSCQQFFVTRTGPQVAAVHSKVQEVCKAKEKGKIDNLTLGVHCLCKYQDGNWYRAQVAKIEEEGVTVYYVDFGNMDTVPFQDLRPLTPELTSEPAQAIRCCISGLEPLKPSCDEEFSSLVLNEEVKMTVKAHEDHDCVVELFSKHTGQSVTSCLVQKGVAKSTVVYHVPDPAPIQLPSECFWDVYVTHVCTTTDLVIRLVGPEYSEKLEQLESALESQCSQCGPVSAVVEGEVYGGLFEADGWHRVRVKSSDGKQVECILVDHGDTETVDIGQLRPLTAELNTRLAYQAVSCSLEGLEDLENNEIVLEKLYESVLGITCVAEVHERGHTICVTLFDTSGAEDVNLNQALAGCVKDEDLTPKLPEDDEQVEGYVSHIADSGSIYFQVVGQGLERLNELMQEAGEYYSKKISATEFVSHPDVGKIVCAKYSGDGFWYRAKVTTQQTGRQVEVLFVDYGNTEVVQVNTLREMTRASKHLKTLPFQAIECQLHALPPLGGSWTASAMYRFLELAPPDRLVTLKVIDSTSQPPAVEIFIPGEVNEEFLHSINQLLLSEPEIFMPDDSCSDTVDEDVLQESQTDISLNQSSYSDEPDNSLYITVDEFSESAISDLPNMDANATGSEETLSLNNNTDVKNQNAGSAGVPSERPQSTSSSLGEISAGGDGLCCQLTVLSLEDCDTLPRPPLLQIPKPGDYLDVHVSLVFNPGNFVCVPYESMEETLELMAQMSVFYTKVPNAKVSIDKVKPGDLLAGVLEGVWYRVEVRALVGEQVSVYFVDYGDFSIMSPEDFQPLPAHFRYMPFQAVKAKLAGVQPLGGRDWSKAAKDRFIELANEKDLVGLICNDKDSDRVAIRLIDTSQEGVDLTIDSVLVEEGLVERK